MAIPHRPHGYIPDPAGTERFVASLPTPTMSQAGPNLAYDPKRDVVLWPAIEAVSPGYSRAAQQIGSCTGHGYSMMIDTLSATQIAVHGAAEDWPGRSLEAAIYAFSRCEVRGRTNAGTADGSSGSSCAKACLNYGTLHYNVRYDAETFTEYSGTREKIWGASGVPDSLEKFAKLNRVTTTTLVTTFGEFAAACQSGYATAVCSMQGFTFKRDSDGFCGPGRTPWSHCLCLIGVRGGKRPGGLVVNSWGANSNSGPHYSGIPDAPDSMPTFFRGCTWWADADVIDRMLSQQDSFSCSQYMGFPPRRLPSWTGGVL